MVGDSSQGGGGGGGQVNEILPAIISDGPFAILSVRVLRIKTVQQSRVCTARSTMVQ